VEIFQVFVNSSLFEKLAFFSSILYVITAALEKKYCWLFSIFSTLIYIRLTFQVQLFFESILNIFYLLVAIKGLLDWNYLRDDDSISINFKPLRFHLNVLIVGFLLVFILGYFANKYTNQSLSYLDAFTTVFSFITTYMVIKKIIENWIYWIVIDGLSVYLYYSKNLKLTAFLFLIFTFLAIYGFFNWRKIMKLN
jgi:nicotinamide mononucleotide transporter